VFVCKRINFGSAKLKCSDRHSLTQQWNTSCRPMSKPSCESTSFGKFLSLRLEINYVNWLPIEDSAARSTSSRARKRKTDLLRECTPVRDYTQNLPVQFENSHVVRFAKARCTPGHDFQNRLEFAVGEVLMILRTSAVALCCSSGARAHVRLLYSACPRGKFILTCPMMTSAGGLPDLVRQHNGG
jgi:hypothetical protein